MTNPLWLNETNQKLNRREWDWMKYLIDTNICIYIMNKRPQDVIKKFKEFSPGEIGISTITVSELQYGFEKSIHQSQNERAKNVRGCQQRQHNIYVNFQSEMIKNLDMRPECIDSYLQYRLERYS